jgi:hypothetical protein
MFDQHGGGPKRTTRPVRYRVTYSAPPGPTAAPTGSCGANPVAKREGTPRTWPRRTTRWMRTTSLPVGCRRREDPFSANARRRAGV